MIPVDEVINTLEFETLAKSRLAPDLFATVGGSERHAFEKITFRPRLMVDTTKLDLSVDLFGQKHFAPILIGPVPLQQRFHAEGELAMARGASAAKAGFVLTDDSSYPPAKVAALTSAPLWYQVDAAADFEKMRAKAQAAIQLGCRVICVNGPVRPGAIEQLRKVLAVPLVLKGVMSAGETRLAIQQGVAGIVVSNYRGRIDSGFASPMEVLPGIVTAAAGQIPVLVDGSFRRGSDVLKALALGARAVLVARPAIWGLATYGDAGVQRILELLQSELARDMAMCGLPDLGKITARCIMVHRR